MAEEFWSEYEQSVREESAGGGVVAQVEVTTGYKTFPQGIAQADSYFPAPARDKAARGEAKAKAAAQIKQHNLSSRPQWGIMIRLDKENAFTRNGAATWEADLFKWAASYTDACKEVIVPSLKELNLQLPWKGWARVTQRPDPYYVKQGEAGMTDKDQDGNPRYPSVWYIAETYPSKEEAMKVVEGLLAAGFDAEDLETLPEVPEMYGAEEWEKMIPEVKGFLSRRVGKATDAEVVMAGAKEFGVKEAYIQQLLDEVKAES